jgi:type II secretory pathway pseudopilin PulG
MNVRRKLGFSLIEVITVMVLLLIGIFSVIRLFPPGFLINRRTDEETSASRLAKQEMERYSVAAVNLMGAVIPVMPQASGAGFSWVYDPNVAPNDLNRILQAPFGLDPYYLSDVNQTRRIIGESVRIPVASVLGQGQRAGIYMLQSGPIYDVNSFASSNPCTAASATSSLRVYGGPMQRRYAEVTDVPSLDGPSQYAIDEDDGAVFFYPVDYPRSFVASYSFINASNQLQTAVSERIPSDCSAFPQGVIPAGFSGWVRLANRNIVRDSDSVAREFRRLNLADPWAFETGTPVQDPYEFKLLSQTVQGTGNVGVLAFSPIGRDHTEQTANGSVPLTAYVDYDVLDWHIIHEDRPMPGAAPFQVKLSLKRIKKLGDIADDQTQYLGLFRNAGLGAVDFLVYNTATGALVPQSAYSLDHRTGTVTFDNTFGAANAGGSFRFYYMAEGDWAVQVQKATDKFRRVGIATPGFGEYYVGYRLDNSPAVNRQAPTLFFPVTEAGKTVSIRQINYVDQNGVLRQAGNESFKINDDPAQFVTIAGRRLTWVMLTQDQRHLDAYYWPFNDGSVNTSYIFPIEPVTGVQGVSFRVRVIWNDGVAIADGGGTAPRIRWRKFDVDTVLTRSPN